MTVDQAAALSPLPDAEPFGLLDGAPDTSLWPLLYRHLVRGRRFNEQATALTRQGRLAVYPSSAGQEACQVAAALALGPCDWLFPSYRDTLAAVTRGVEPVAALDGGFDGLAIHRRILQRAPDHLLPGDLVGRHEGDQGVVPAQPALPLAVQVHDRAPAAGHRDQITGDLSRRPDRNAGAVDDTDQS